MEQQKDPIKVLFVCLGNICRSPMAEGIFEHLVEEKGLSNRFVIDSAGTSGYHVGERADARMRSTAAQQGIALNSRSRQFRKQDLTDFDYVLAMDSSNLRNMKAMQNPGSHAQLLLMRDYDSEEGSPDVPDPYYGGDRGFQEVFDILMRANTKFLSELQSRHSL